MLTPTLHLGLLSTSKIWTNDGKFNNWFNRPELWKEVNDDLAWPAPIQNKVCDWLGKQ